MRKGQRSWGPVAVPNLRTKQTLRNTKILTFGPIIASVTIKAVSLQLNGMVMMWKLQQAMQDHVIQTARIHPTVHPGNRDEVFIWPISSLLGEILVTRPARSTGRVVTKISSCRVNTTSRRGIKRLGISFGSIFLLFSNKSSRGPLS